MANGGNALGGDLSVSPDLAPGSVANQLMFGPRGQPPAAAAPARPHFDLALGDSIAAQQYHHGIGGLATPRMYSANPDPIDWNSNKYTAEVGAPPTRILARVKDMLAKDPDALRGKNIFLGIGSNQPDVEGQFDAIPEVLKTLQEAGVGHVTVPSLGPGVPNSAALNIQLGSMVKGAGDNFTFFSPNIKWQKDGVHPANGQDMQNEALKAVQQAEGGSGEASRTPPPPSTAPTPTPTVGAPTPLVSPGSLYTPPSPLQAPAGSGYTLGPMPLPGSEPGMRLPGMPPAPGGAPVDPDAGKFVNWQGMRIPMADAKRMIRMTEPGAQGYNAAFGSHSGLPSGYQTDQNGFPIWSGNPVGSMYGGAFEGKLSHAAGMYQFEPDTWASAVGALRDQGVNINDFSQGSQEAVASHLLEQSGFGPWAPWNPNLRAMLAQYKQTGQVPSGTDPGEGAVATSAVGPYRSGDVVPGTGMAVGGQLSGFVPYVPPLPANQLAPGRQVASAGGTDSTDGTSTPSGDWTPDPSKFTQPGGLAGQGSLLDDPKYRQALMFQILGAQMQGIKFHPSTYNPQAGNQQLPVGEPIRFLAGPMTIRPNETFGSAALRGAWYE